MLTKLYRWVLSLSTSPKAEVFLALVAFAESFVFPIPPDVLFAPMVATRPPRAFRYAILATTASVLGGITGWMLGFYVYEEIAKPILVFYWKLDASSKLLEGLDLYTSLLIVTSGLVHVPPIKVMTLVAGAAQFPLWLFVLLAALSRGARFSLLAWLFHHYGPQIIDLVERYLRLAICLIVFIIFVFYYGTKLVL